MWAEGASESKSMEELDTEAAPAPAKHGAYL